MEPVICKACGFDNFEDLTSDKCPNCERYYSKVNAVKDRDSTKTYSSRAKPSGFKTVP